MRIRLHQRMAGPAGNFAAGDIIEVDAATAKALIESHQASPAKDSMRAEKATVSAEEFAKKSLEKAGIKPERPGKKAGAPAEKPEETPEKAA